MALTPLDPDTITDGIQLAVAPVCLLTAASGIIAAVAGRLPPRIIDRAWMVEQQALNSTYVALLACAMAELGTLRRRGHLTNASIALLTSCACVIGLTIILLFLGKTTAFQSSRWAVAGCLGGVVCFLLALLCSLTEAVIATRLLDFDVLRS